MAGEKSVVKKRENMETIAFTLIGRGKETFVPEAAEFRPFDLPALRQSYNAKENSAIRASDGNKSFVAQAS
jgi:hypothetical protein